MIGLIPGAATMIARNMGLLKWLIPAGLLLATALYVWSLTSALDRAEAALKTQRAQLDQATAANASLVASIEDLKRNHQRETAALKLQAEASARAALQAARARQFVHDQKQKSDPLADALLDGAVKRLRKPRAPAGDQPENREAAPAGVAAHLP
jgi:hypothetical protein